MNADRLLAHYEKIANAPDAIPLLRRFVLDLAVRGKLVEQDPNDESAEELLTRISTEKARAAKKWKIRTKGPLPAFEPSELQFELPTTWSWVRIRNVTSDRGQVVPDQDFTYVDVTAINKEVGRIEEPKVTAASDAPSRARKIVCKGDVLYSCVRPYLLNIAIVDTDISPPPIASTAFAVLNGFGLVLPRYQWIVLRSPYFVICVEQRMRGQAYPAINDSDFALLPFPLPPLAEQHRIVAKVDELMVLCDRLDTARKEQETTRDRLATASLARLNVPDPDRAVIQDHAAFAVDNLIPLTTRPDQINALRKTILNLAVRGKLVGQDSNDEPATKLLKRIAMEKAQLAKARKIRAKGPLPAFEPNELQFELPATWSWVRIRNVTSDRGQMVPDQDFTYVDVTAINKEVGRIEELKVTAASDAPSRARKIVCKGDVLYSCVRPYLLNIAIVDTDISPPPIASTAFAVLNGFGLVLPRYQWIVLRSPYFVTCVEQRMRGQAYPAINDSDFALLPFPLPPLAEQRRIVTKVDELMGLCDQLEASLAGIDETRRHLLDALLHEALTPSEERIRRDISMIVQELPPNRPDRRKC